MSDWFCKYAILILFGFNIGWWGHIGLSYSVQKEAIEAGHAYHHPETAEFTWKEVGDTAHKE